MLKGFNIYRINQFYLFLLLVVILSFSSCNITSSLRTNEKLLVKNKIIIKDKVKNKSKLKEELQLICFQKPNAKLFYTFPLKLSIYNLAHKDGKNEKKFAWWLKNKLGEPPVIFKEPLVIGSASSMKNYVFNLGYLHADVKTQVESKNKKVIVKYTIEANEPFKINNINLPEGGKAIAKIIRDVSSESLLKKGELLNIKKLELERKRIADALKDRGYYLFSKQYISFDLDTIGKGKNVDLIMLVNPPKKEKGQQKFKINDVYIYMDYYIDKSTKELQLDTFEYDGYKFITENYTFLPKPILFGVFFKKGDYYSLKNELKTQKKIVSFGAYKFVNIEYRLVDSIENKLDAFIFLTPSKKQALSADIELSHSFEGLSGSVLSLTYKNKNLTKKSDLLQFKLSGGVELNLFNRQNNNLLNTADISADLSYTVNRFIVPFPLRKVSKNSNVKTKFSLLYNYEERINRFTKHSTTFTAGYEWNETQTKKHFYNPISISLLLIPRKDPAFQQQLDQKPSLQRSFEENIVLGSNYTFLMTNKKGEEDRSYFKFQGDVFMAGNFVHAIMLAVKTNSLDVVPYKILGKEYAQFARFEGNIVQHNKLTLHSELVTRLNAGIILPYGNSTVSPYFQQFFVGGANSIRAFRLRALGPGSYESDNSINNTFLDQSGDIKIEANIEYRFDLYKWFKWAFFVDAGNVWGLKEDPDRPGGVFKGDFYKTIAVGFGTGLRLDFSYFVIRTDLAMPILDPRNEPNKRWMLNQIDFTSAEWRNRNLVFNLAIGYPF